MPMGSAPYHEQASPVIVPSTGDISPILLHCDPGLSPSPRSFVDPAMAPSPVKRPKGTVFTPLLSQQHQDPGRDFFMPSTAEDDGAGSLNNSPAIGSGRRLGKTQSSSRTVTLGFLVE